MTLLTIKLIVLNYFSIIFQSDLLRPPLVPCGGPQGAPAPTLRTRAVAHESVNTGDFESLNLTISKGLNINIWLICWLSSDQRDDQLILGDSQLEAQVLLQPATPCFTCGESSCTCEHTDTVRASSDSNITVGSVVSRGRQLVFDVTRILCDRLPPRDAWRRESVHREKQLTMESCHYHCEKEMLILSLSSSSI